MTFAASQIAAWVAKYNAELALYTTEVAATTAEHNARYVNGAGTGPLWSAQDATDVAALAAANASLAAEVTLYNTAEAARVAAVALAAARLAAGSGSTPVSAGASMGFSSGGASSDVIGSLVIPTTGYWVGWAYVRIYNDGVYAVLSANIGGTNYPTNGGPQDPYALWTWNGVLTSGQTVSWQLSESPRETGNGNAFMYFVPTPTYPH